MSEASITEPVDQLALFGVDVERWVPCVRSSRYAISSHGRVRTVRGNRWKPAGLCRLSNMGGYPCVGINRQVTRVHILMLEAFVGPRPEGMVIRHLDGNPENNHLSNIVYGTHAENSLDACRHGSMSRGLKPADVRKIRDLVSAGGLSLTQIGARYGVGKSCISNIASGRRWGWLPQEVAAVNP